MGGLVAGVTVWRAADGPESIGRQPFVAALVRLSAQPAVRYRVTGDGMAFDARVTYSGSVLGAAQFGGLRMQTLTAGGRTFVKMPAGLPGDGHSDPTGLAGKWITGRSGVAAAGPGAAAASEAQTPAELARRLLVALNSTQTVLPEREDATSELAGTPVWKAGTPAGDLYVSRNVPHRLLRIVPKVSGARIPSLPAVPSLPSLATTPPGMSSAPSMPSLPSPASAWGPRGPQRAVTAAFRPPRRAGLPAVSAPAAAGTTMDVSSLSQQEVDKLFDELVDATRQLDKAVDADVRFQVEGSANLSCSPAGCTVVAQVSNSLSATGRDGQVTGGTVTAMLTATVQVDGMPAGSCTAVASLPLNDSSSISCLAGSAGPVFARQQALKRQQAEAQSRAQGGRPVPYSVQSTAQAVVNALAQVDVAHLVSEQQIERDLTKAILPEPGGQPGPTGPGPHPSGTPARPSPTGPPNGLPLDDDDFADPLSCFDKQPTGAYAPHGRGKGWILNTTGPAGRTGPAMACLQNVDGHTTNPTGLPVGLAAAKDRALSFRFPAADVARCHVIGAQLGGSNLAVDHNLSPCWQNPVNSPRMLRVENKVRRHARGEVLIYSVTPVYLSSGSTVPWAFVMRASSSDPAGQVVWSDATYVPNVRYKDGKALSLAN
ncbi:MULTISPECIES: DNA/RNA non-specific endonuclease [unclassified Streptomyces]|uniref:DNA/RNA non-specific endonuclease n=1 Tax=unclassified Streptomyces TaxID=2593676 RepID=UPI0037026D93